MKKIIAIALMAVMILPASSAFAATPVKSVKAKEPQPTIVCYLNDEMDVGIGVSAGKSISKGMNGSTSVGTSISVTKADGTTTSKGTSISVGTGYSDGVSKSDTTSSSDTIISEPYVPSQDVGALINQSYLNGYTQGYADGFSKGFLDGIQKAKEFFMGEAIKSVKNKNKSHDKNGFPCSNPVKPVYPEKIKPRPLPLPKDTPVIIQPLREK